MPMVWHIEFLDIIAYSGRNRQIGGYIHSKILNKDDKDNTTDGMLPQHAPLYPDIPYRYSNYKRISLYGHADEEGIRELLPDQLDYVSNEFEAFVLHAPDVNGLPPYHEGGFVVRAGYDDIEGAHMLCEYVDNDAAVAAGREFWGYPKKMATVTIDEKDDTIEGTITRQGADILQLTFTEEDIEHNPPQLFPRLQVKQIPSADGSGYDVNQIVKMGFKGDDADFDADNVSQRVAGDGKVDVEQSDADPLHKLGPLNVNGGAIITGSFTLDTGEIIADLNNGGER